MGFLWAVRNDEPSRLTQSLLTPFNPGPNRHTSPSGFVLLCGNVKPIYLQAQCHCFLTGRGRWEGGRYLWVTFSWQLSTVFSSVGMQFLWTSNIIHTFTEGCLDLIRGTGFLSPWPLLGWQGYGCTDQATHHQLCADGRTQRVTGKSRSIRPASPEARLAVSYTRSQTEHRF